MRHVVWLIVILVMFIGCAKDIIVEPPPGLRGAYEGIYKIQKKVGSGNPPAPIEQYVDWTFTDQRFFCVVDTVANQEIKICDFSGNYELVASGGVLFTDTIVGVCTGDHSDIVIDEFSLTTKRPEDAPDTLEFSRSVGAQPELTIKTLILILIED